MGRKQQFGTLGSFFFGGGSFFFFFSMDSEVKIQNPKCLGSSEETKLLFSTHGFYADFL